MLQVGVIGAGLYGNNHLLALSQRERYHRDVQLIGFADIDSARRKKMEALYGIKGYNSHSDLLKNERVDAVTVATPDHLHYEIVMDCLEAGIPVLAEKPLSTSLEEVRKMVDTAQSKNLLLQVDYHKRFDPYHIDLKLRVEEGELGSIQYGYCWMEDVLRVGTDMIGQKSWSFHGSPGWFLAIHMIDLSYWILGCPKPLSVSAYGFKGKLSSMGIDIYDSMKIQVVFSNQVVITYDTSVVLPNSHESIVRQGIKLVGTEGFLEVNSQYRGARGCSTNKGMETPNLGMMYRDMDKSGNVVKKGYFSDSIVDFIENINYLNSGHTLEDLDGKYASGQQGLESTKIGVAMHLSAQQGGIPINISNW